MYRNFTGPPTSNRLCLNPRNFTEMDMSVLDRSPSKGIMLTAEQAKEHPISEAQVDSLINRANVTAIDALPEYRQQNPDFCNMTRSTLTDLQNIRSMMFTAGLNHPLARDAVHPTTYAYLLLEPDADTRNTSMEDAERRLQNLCYNTLVEGNDGKFIPVAEDAKKILASLSKNKAGIRASRRYPVFPADKMWAADVRTDWTADEESPRDRVGRQYMRTPRPPTPIHNEGRRKASAANLPRAIYTTRSDETDLFGSHSTKSDLTNPPSLPSCNCRSCRASLAMQQVAKRRRTSRNLAAVPPLNLARMQQPPGESNDAADSISRQSPHADV